MTQQLEDLKPESRNPGTWSMKHETWNMKHGENFQVSNLRNSFQVSSSNHLNFSGFNSLIFEIWNLFENL
jgi:hypothetical protein